MPRTRSRTSFPQYTKNSRISKSGNWERLKNSKKISTKWITFSSLRTDTFFQFKLGDITEKMMIVQLIRQPRPLSNSKKEMFFGFIQMKKNNGVNVVMTGTILFVSTHAPL